MKRRNGYSFTDRPLSKNGKLSLALSGISAAAFLFCIIASALSGGGGSSYIGAVSLCAGLLALYGCAAGVKDLAEKNKAFRKPYAGTIASGVIFIMWLAVYLTGLKG